AARLPGGMPSAPRGADETLPPLASEVLKIRPVAGWDLHSRVRLTKCAVAGPVSSPMALAKSPPASRFRPQPSEEHPRRTALGAVLKSRQENVEQYLMKRASAMLALVAAVVAVPARAQFNFNLDGHQVQIHSFGSQGFAYSNKNNFLSMKTS